MKNPLGKPYEIESRYGDTTAGKLMIVFWMFPLIFCFLLTGYMVVMEVLR